VFDYPQIMIYPIAFVAGLWLTMGLVWLSLDNEWVRVVIAAILAGAVWVVVIAVCLALGAAVIQIRALGLVLLGLTLAAGVALPVWGIYEGLRRWSE
jgi:hypothetical protein